MDGSRSCQMFLQDCFQSLQLGSSGGVYADVMLHAPQMSVNKEPSSSGHP